MICKNCGKEFEGSGDFCSKHCLRSFAGKLGGEAAKGKHRPRVEYVCNICNKTFLGQKTYRAHKSLCSHKGPKPKDDGWNCPICNSNFITRRELQAHRKKEHGSKQNRKKIDFVCQFCGKEYIQKNTEYKSLHEKHCKENPNRIPWKSHPHTEAEKLHLSELAKKNCLGGWHSSQCFIYNGIRLDSSYELILAQDLDKNGIKWERPKPFLYKLNGKEHRYYPDFYLPEYGIYADTKNDHLINDISPRLGITDTEKIHLVEQQNNIRVYILDKNHLSWSSFRSLLT